jgi:hypothetical protein
MSRLGFDLKVAIVYFVVVTTLFLIGTWIRQGRL